MTDEERKERAALIRASVCSSVGAETVASISYKTGVPYHIVRAFKDLNGYIPQSNDHLEALAKWAGVE